MVDRKFLKMNLPQWSFDNKHFEDVIVKCRQMLESGKLSGDDLELIKGDILVLESFIDGKYEVDVSTEKQTENIEDLKNSILKGMSRHYKMLGESFIKWIMNLEEVGVFDDYELISRNTELSLDELVELTLKNYEKNSIGLLLPAKKILLDDSIRQIQLTSDKSCEYYIDATKTPYVVYNYMDPPCLFNHEIEHAVESLKSRTINEYFSELGAIYYELLFNDEMYNVKGELKKGDFDFRIEQSSDSLYCLYYYFKLMLLFAKKNFDVSTEEFSATILKLGISSEGELEEYLREDISNGVILNDMMYLFSFLKAIELREKIITSRSKQDETISLYMGRSIFQFDIPQDGINIYRRYVEETNQKVKIKI